MEEHPQDQYYRTVYAKQKKDDEENRAKADADADKNEVRPGLPLPTLPLPRIMPSGSRC